MPRKKRHTVAVVALDVVSVFELAVPCEVFGIDRSDIASPWYDFKVCGLRRGPIRTGAGFAIETPHGMDDVRRADTVVVPAISGAGGTYPEEALDAVREAHRRGARVLSLCSGAFFLAAAGLLDGRRATTHWMHADQLAAEYPSIDVDPRVLYIDEGDVLTSAGTAAGVDLCLHIVRQDYGAEVANAVARRMVVPPHRDGGQAQYVDMPVPVSECADDDPLSPVIAWALEHLGELITVEGLARQAAMSPRNFARRFRAVTGTTPLQWVLTQRVLLAQRLLEATDEPVERIADRCGIGSAANLRFHFQRVVGTSPQGYRRTFRQRESADSDAEAAS